MMRNRRFLISFLMFLAVPLLLPLVPSRAIAAQVTDDLKTTIDKVIKVVENERYKNDKKARRAKMHEIIDTRFSYEQMGMRSLAREWNKRTDSERREFIHLFSKLLENSYASKIESYSEEIINYVGEKIKGNYALVKTEIVRKDGTIPVDYKMIKMDGQWKVYDFIIDGVSMVRNYRSQFKKIIRKDSFEVLVKKLADKIAELEKNNEIESDEL